MALPFRFFFVPLCHQSNTSKTMKSFLKILSVFALTALVFTGCKPDDFYLQNTPELSVDRHEVTVSADGGVAEIQVQSTRRWIVTASEGDWFAITPVWLRDDDGNVLVFGGENNGQIRVLVQPNEWGPRQLRLEIETAGGLFQQVDIRQEAGREMYLLLFEDFGVSAPTQSPWGQLATWNYFRREGSGAADVIYRQVGDIAVTLRGNQTSPFSGGANVHFAAGTGTNPIGEPSGVFQVDNIETLGARSLRVSFATSQASDSLSLDYSTDGGETWTNLAFEKTTTTWGLVSVNIPSVDADVQTLSLRFSALRTEHGARIDDLRVEGGDVPPGPRLMVSPTTMDVGYAADVHNISITSNTEWTASSTSGWITFDAPSGTGNQALSFNVTHNPGTVQREGTISISTDNNAITRTVRITQAGEPIPKTMLFRETFGTPSGNTAIAGFQGWVTTGVGSANVTYSQTGNVDLRTTGASPAPFSGSGNVFFPTSAANERTFIISGIEPGSYTNFELSFATNAPSHTAMYVEYSVNGTDNWTEIPYTRTGTAWGLVTANFYLTQPATTLNLRFRVPSGTGGNFRIDDVQVDGYQN